MSKSKILVVCPTDWERTEIAKPELRSQFEFLICCGELHDSIGLWNALRFDARSYLLDIASRYRDQKITGVLGTGDYPGCIFSAFLAQQLGLPAPSPREAVLLSHKYYSRQHQRQRVPEATPEFAQIDPFHPQKPASLDYPFFVKPVKGTMSIRAQMVRDADSFRRAVRLSLRDQLRGWTLLSPYAQLLRLYQSAPIPAYSFIAEAPLRGVQVTVDGFVQNRVSTVMGITDSIMYPGTMSFRRFEYPSSLPKSVQNRMIEIANRLMSGCDFDHSCYNIEMFYDDQDDSISIIEINPRMSYQFSDLFAQVDGVSSFSVQLALATGIPVIWRRGQGPFQVAASFVERLFHDAKVVSIPDENALANVEHRFPGTHIKILCAAGERLSDHDQDVGSYRYCIINMAAQSSQELQDHYEQVTALLPFVFA